MKYNGRPVALVGDKLLCEGTGTLDTTVTGSSFMKINGISVARLGDATAHGGVIVEEQVELKIK
ncbi:PAAR domain-containing protein [Saezia sanguinis]|uniref:PAAR domain-containing protein n=1 Tax=Saezia sanguinis TaxID=1965230 RepID=UPI0019518499|nr:PAAR domain-containing protein [Saezia sanguinis]